MEKFTNIPSQFDNIDTDCPVVFISYSWDSETHKKWVRKLSDDLRAKYSVYTILDQYNRGGNDIIQFMTRGIAVADRVILIGTPIYKEKAEKCAGGARFEDQIISEELYQKIGSSKFIPVLREGKFDTSFMPLIETRTGYDFRDDKNYEERLWTLAADLWNKPLNAAPALGPKPSFVINHSTQTGKMQLVELTFDRFVQEVKRLLSTPYSQIAYTELIEGEVNRAYETIQSKASYSFTITPERFLEYKKLHMDAVSKLIGASIVVVRYGDLTQQKLFVDAMVKLCRKPLVNGEISIENTLPLHLLAATFLFNSIGVACVKFKYFQLLPTIFQTIVPSGNVFSSTYGYNLAYMAGRCHWDSDKLNSYMKSSWIYPFSELISKEIYPFFQDNTIDIEDFNSIYYTWEHLFSLLYRYYNCSPTAYDNFPIGSFVLRKSDFIRMKDNYYTSFFNEAKKQKQEWGPIKQGLFGGNYDTFARIYHEADEYYSNYGRYY